LERKSVVIPRTPRPVKWANFKVGRAGFWLYAGIDRKEGNIQAGISSDYCLNQLKDERNVIEREIGFPLVWGDGEDDFQWIGSIREDVDPANRDDWPAQHMWLAEKLEAFHKVFARRIRELNVDQQQGPDDE
jgi:hypothetical protein